MTRILSRFPGTCVVCGHPFPAGAKIDFDTTTREPRHITCEPFTSPPGAIWLSRGSGSGGEPYHVGAVIPNLPNQEPRWLVVLSARREYWRNDGMSFGVGDDTGYVYRACCRPATEEEAVPLIAQEDRVQRRKALDALRQRFRETGERPQLADLAAGEILSDTSNIYGGGALLLATPTGVWYLERNMRDGNTWDANDVAGAYLGWYLADPTLADQIRALIA